MLLDFCLIKHTFLPYIQNLQKKLLYRFEHKLKYKNYLITE